MNSIRIDWPQLKDQTLQTITGAPFIVVRVTDKHVTVRPLRGSRNYALSIPGELERGVAVYAGTPTFPTPAELGRIGIRPILASYTWGVLKAVLVDGVGLHAIPRITLKDFAGSWVITETPNLDEAYLARGLGPPSMQLHVSVAKQLKGQYLIGLSAGSLLGSLREFGGEKVVIFSYAGGEDLEPVGGGGWLRLLDADTMEGEFLETLGPFIAQRKRTTVGRTHKSRR